MNLPSASQVERVLSCPASHALPQSPDAPGDAALDGTARHSALASRVAGLSQTPQTPRETAALEWLDGIDEEVVAELRGTRSEVALAYDVLWSSGRVVGANVGRNYGDRSSTEIVGSADYLTTAEPGLWIVDLKTGRAEVTAPGDNAQLLTLAVAARAALGTTGHARLSLLLAPDGSTPRWLHADVAAGELNAHAERLARMAVEIEDSRADVAAGVTPRHLHDGEHCRYCPAKAACPLRAALARTTLEHPVDQADEWRAMMRDGRRAEVYRAWRAARDVLGEVGDALHASAKEAAIDLGDGQAFGPRQTTRRTIDAEAAWPLLVAVAGAEVARAAMSLDTSAAGIKRAARLLWRERKHAGRKDSLKATEGELLAAVESVTGIRTSERVEEYRTGALSADNQEQK